MIDLFALIAQYGLALVFANVLLEQLGVPVPAVPTLVVAGALAIDGSVSVGGLFLVTIGACLLADGLWFAAGRRYGNRVMRLLCRVSLSPDTCVRQAEVRFEHWGVLLLPFAKFLPGLSTVTPPLAGAMHMSWPKFLLWNSIGAALWSGTAIGVGMVFHKEVTNVLRWLENYGHKAILLVLALLAVYIAIKWWQRARFYRMLRVARITVDELHDLIKGSGATVVDVRSPTSRELDARFIPGALALDDTDVLAQLSHLPTDREIVFYCTCPNEASAAAVAKRLMAAGYTRVRPLLGGLDAWVDAGLEVETRSVGPGNG